ncbi:MAG TPA: cobalamin-dependent protein [Thermoanaerobaculia bacterium]|jgi:methanogenic corrinoid protein MtbC1
MTPETIERLAIEITERQLAADPSWIERFGEKARVRGIEDARFHLQYLDVAVSAQSPVLFLDYIAWVKVVLATRNIGERELLETLRLLRDVVDADAARIVDSAIDALPSMPGDVEPILDPRAPLWAVATEYLNALLQGSRRDAASHVSAALDNGASLRDVYRHVFEPVQQEIGRLWQLNRISVAQEHFCTAATQQLMAQLYPRMFGGERREKRAVAMCVGGELHEVGLRIVTDLLELDGWQTWYLGASVPPASAVELCAAHRADVLLISATLPPHIPQTAEVIRLLRAKHDARVLLGGRAFRNTPELWRTIGADGYAANADDAIELANRLTT